MFTGRIRLVWALAACATLVAQVAPQPICGACDQPCCAVGNGDGAPAVPEAASVPSFGCPLCAAGDESSSTATNVQPCGCQLDARQGQPLALSRGSIPADGPGHAALAVAHAASEVPAVLGVSREYLATGRDVPIRPARILFGVWRN